MKSTSYRWKAVLAAAVVTGGTAFGQSSDAILDLLMKKGIINQREANEVREQLDQQAAQTVEMYNKVKTSSWVNSIQFFGDGRLRYEWRAGKGTASGVDSLANPLDNADLDRFRYRVRFGLKGDLGDNFSYGLRLETATKGNSANVTLGGQGLSGGPFAKGGNSGINVGQIWGQYKPCDNATFIAGKFENPFITSPLVWDGDLNPEGAAQKFTLKTEPVDWFLTLGEFTYNNTKTQNAFGKSGQNVDTWLFGAQAGGKMKFTKVVSLTVAPTIYAYANAGELTGSKIFIPAATTNGNNITGINDLLILEVPAELAFPLGTLPAKIFGEFCVNLNGKERAQDAGTNVVNFAPYIDQKYAYQAGLAIGTAKKKGDFLIKGYWQHSELFALDQNLVDSDIFDGRLNIQGPVVSAQYQFTDFLSGVVTYAHASAIKSALPTLTGAGDLGGNLRRYDLLQADVNWKF
jgi:hypothetical protein